MRVAVIHDGTAADSSRPDITSQLEVIEEVKTALRKNSHETGVIPCLDDIQGFLAELRDFNPGRVFNLCESVFGESGLEPLMPSILEAAGFSSTGAGSGTLLLSNDKLVSKSILRLAGIPVPAFRLIKAASGANAADIPFPVILKPSREHASSGIDEDSIFYENGEKFREKARSLIKTFNQPVLAEKFIEGREISVALLGNGVYEILPPSEIKFAGTARICGYRAKWLPGSEEYKNTLPECPARTGAGLAGKLSGLARLAASSHSLAGYARVDFRLDASLNPFVIDINPNPDLGRNSGLARSAKAAGTSYEELVEKILRLPQPKTK